ncbi:MAG: response regulator, partial [Lentisphaeraceae bacterium]|nr:response regulator [Lentisphaeraceae bacterium]
MVPNKKILFVDDEERILHGYRRMLRPEYNLWDMFFANCAKDALHIMAREKIDLVLSDVMMPGTGGKELMGTIKKNWPFTPVIMITGKVASIEAAVEHIRSGACDYLTKPVSCEKLKETIKKVLIIGEESKLPLSDNRMQRRHLAGYEIMGHIDEGTTGVVFLAEKDIEGQRRKVALKILKSMDSIHPDERQEAIDRFAREGSVASGINHPNIVKVLGYGIADSEKIPYIAMEYIEGMSLTSFMEKSRPSSLYQGLGIVCDIADALSAVHDQNICHRDVKPSNIIINKSGTALLTDFGLACFPNS